MEEETRFKKITCMCGKPIEMLTQCIQMSMQCTACKMHWLYSSEKEIDRRIGFSLTHKNKTFIYNHFVNRLFYQDYQEVIIDLEKNKKLSIKEALEKLNKFLAII